MALFGRCGFNCSLCPSFGSSLHAVYLRRSILDGFWYTFILCVLYDAKAVKSQDIITREGHHLLQLKAQVEQKEWKRALDDIEEGEEQQKQLVSSTLQELCTDDAAGLLSAPVCSFFSSTLIKLELRGWGSKGMERFSREQENAFQLLYSLQEFDFSWFDDLQQLPAGLRNLTSLKILSIYDCPAVLSLPKDDLPKSLQELHVYGRRCNNELKQQCRGLEGTIPIVNIDL